MGYRVDPNAKNVWVRDNADTMDLSVQTDANSVYFNNGRTMEQEFGKGVMLSNVVTIDSGMEKVIDGTYDGVYESLVFKGKSLVNLVTHSKHQNVNVQNLLDSNGRLSWNTTGVWGKVGFTVQGKPNSTYCVKYSDKHTTLGFFVRYMDGLSGTTQPITTLNSTCRKFTTDTTGIFTLTLEQGEATTDSWIQDFMILEYQEGMENWDIPYFEGLCDVKAPTLKNVGKNLFDMTMVETDTLTVRFWDTTITRNTIKSVRKGDNVAGQFGAFLPLKVKPSTTYTIQRESYKNNQRVANGIAMYVYHNSSIWGYSLTSSMQDSFSFTTLPDTDHITIGVNYGVYDIGTILETRNIQLEESDVQTLYEDHKTNILETSNDLVLRGLPSGIRDTYDCLTGEYIRRVGERDYQESDESDSNVITDLVKTHYELAEPIVTQIEPSTTPFAYENGHIILESGHEGQSLLPTLEYQTVVSRSGQVAMIDKTIQQHERKITLLEKMLVQNIIDIEYKNTLLALKLEIDEVI